MKRVLAFLLVAVLLVTFVPSASAEQLYRLRETRTRTLYNSCAGESVELVYDVQITAARTVNANNESYSSHLKYHGTGLGLSSGAKYVYHVEANRAIHRSSNDGAYTQSWPETFKLQGQGGAGDWFAKAWFHITINANGEVTSDFLNWESGCRQEPG